MNNHVLPEEYEWFDSLGCYQIKKAKKLLDEGFDINTTDHNNKTALSKFTESDDKEIVQFLLENNANPNCADYNGHTPLMLSASRDNYSIIRLLLKHNAALELKADKTFKTALTFAVENNSILSLDALIRAKANIEVTGKDYQTPIFRSIKHDFIESFKTLQDAGADIYKKDSLDRSILTFIGHHGAEKILNHLIKNLDFHKFKNSDIMIAIKAARYTDNDFCANLMENQLISSDINKEDKRSNKPRL